MKLARPFAREASDRPQQALMDRARGVPVDNEPGIEATQRRAQNPPPFAARYVLFGPEQLVTGAEISAQRRCLTAERSADFVPHARRRHHEALEACLARPETPV